MTDAAPSLEEVLEAVAADLERVDRREADGHLEWSVGGKVFAKTAEDGAEFRLSPAVAEAAKRTPDAGASPRGADWVRFSPGELDQHALDRATAWLTSAWRRADLEG